MMNTKICTKCKNEKDLNEFTKNKTAKDGLRSRCKSCRAEDSKEYYQRQDVRVAHNRYCKEYNNRPENKERLIKYRKEYWLLKKYNISLDERNSMIDKQKNLCVICRKKLGNGIKSCIDHCHKTGNVRGILCRECNLMLGYVDDNMNILRRAISYIEEYREDK